MRNGSDRGTRGQGGLASRLPDFPWTLGAAALAVALTTGALVPGPWTDLVAALVADREAVAAGEPWRLLTGPLVHGNLGHLARDTAVFLLLGAVFEREVRAWALLLAAALAAPTAAVLIFDPQVDVYLGLSGAVNTLLGVAFVRLLRTAPRPALWVVALALAWIGKVGFEALTGGLLMPMDLGAGIRPAPVAHLAGAVLGLAWAILGTPRSVVHRPSTGPVDDSREGCVRPCHSAPQGR